MASTDTATTTDTTTNPAAAAAGSGVDTAVKLRAIATELGQRFYERDDVARTLITTVLAGQHSLLLGPPGTAKSELARELTSRITGARYWEILLSKFTDPKRMFGPIDVAALSQGQYRQVYEGRATQCEIAFLDEIFKCSTAALNETLALLNERIYHPENGGAPITCPLIAAITASNELHVYPGGSEDGTDDHVALIRRIAVQVRLNASDDAREGSTEVDLVEAVERVANHMRQEWGFLITDDAIEFFRTEYDHRYADRCRDQGTLTDADATACHRMLDATDSEINAALAELATRRADR